MIITYLLQSLIGWVSFLGQHTVEITAKGHASSKTNPTSKARTGSRIIPRRIICKSKLKKKKKKDKWTLFKYNTAKHKRIIETFWLPVCTQG